MEKPKELIWNWNGVPTKLSDFDQGQLCAIKNCLSKSSNNWFGEKKSTWTAAIDPLLKRFEHINIKHIVHYQNTKRVISANQIADKIIQCFTKNDNQYGIKNKA